MGDFVYKYRKLIIVVVIIVVLTALFSAFTTRPTATTQPTLDKDQQTGDIDDVFIDHTDAHFSIVSDSDLPQYLTINSDPGYRNAAISKIYEFELNPTDYLITFTYDNPFRYKGPVQHDE